MFCENENFEFVNIDDSRVHDSFDPILMFVE